MARKVRIDIHDRAIRALLQSGGVRADLLSRGQRVLSAAQGGAPVESGDLRDSLSVWEDTTDRAVVRVGSDLDYAPLIAANTGFLSRALDAAG